jgi:hypothetical protein
MIYRNSGVGVHEVIEFKVFVMMLALSGMKALFDLGTGIAGIGALRTSVRMGMVLIAPAIVGVAGIVFVWQTRDELIDRARLRDLQAIGVEQLREEAKGLMERNWPEPLEVDPRGFGQRIPLNAVPPTLRKFNTRPPDSYFAISGLGVTAANHFYPVGITAGFLVTPPGSTKRPRVGQRLADGIYWVVTNWNNPNDAEITELKE